MTIELRPYQDYLVGDIRTALKSYRRVLAESPTGSGKTAIGTYIVHGGSQRGMNCMFLVHRTELMRQTSRAFEKQGIAHETIESGRGFNPHHNVYIGAIQTVANRVARIPKIDLLIVDEAHHSCSPSWAATIEALNPRWIIGLSATPCRLDGKGLSESFDTIVHGPAVADLIEMGFLSPYRIFAPSSVDLTGVKTVAGDYNRSDIDKLMDKPKIIGDAVAHYSKFTPNARAVVFCTSILHANHVAEHFSASGFNAASVDGKMAKGERAEILQKFEAGEIRVLTSCDLVSEGFDLPNIEVAISLRPTASLSLWLQQVGRCLRIADGKNCATIFDHVGNTLRHGFPDERREWTLNPKKKKASRGSRDDAAEVNIKCCEKCFMVHKPAPICPHCGHVHPIATREIEQVDGELVELDAARIKREARIEQGRAQILEELKAIEISRGYKNGWAWHIFNSRNKKSGVA